MKSRALTLLPNEARGLFNAAAEPTLVGLTGKDSFNQVIADGGQAADLLDGDRDARLTVNTNGVATVFHLDAALARRLRVDRVILDGHTLRQAYGDDVGNLVQVLYNSTDNYGTATEAAIARVQSRLLAHGPAYLDFDGDDDVVTAADASDKAAMGIGDFSVFARVKRGGTNWSEIISRGLYGECRMWGMAFAPTGLYIEIKSSSSAGKTFIYTFTEGETYTIGFKRVGNTITGYINGISVGTHTGGAIAESLSVSNKPIRIGRLRLTDLAYCEDGVYEALIFNRALSDAEFLDLHNGIPVAAADRDGSTVSILTGDDSTFDSDTGNWDKGIEWTIAGGKATHSGEAGNLRLDTPLMGASGKYTWVQLTVSGQTAGILKVNYGTAFYALNIYENGTYWVKSPVVGNRKLYLTADADFDGSVDDVTMGPSGCVAEYRPEGVSPTHGKWHDRSSNKLHGIITGAEARYVPSGDEGEVLLIELEQEIDARYWYIKGNPDELTADANTLFGQMLLGRAAALSGVREFDEELGYPGIDTLEAYGGSELPSVRYECERREWSLHLVAQGDDFRDGIERAYRAAKGAKKVPLYLVEDIIWNDGIKTWLIYCVKFDAPIRKRKAGKYHELVTALREMAG